MSHAPVNSFRFVLPVDGHVAADGGGGALLREALETTDLLRYARRQRDSVHDRIRFLLELAASRRWLEVTLATDYASGAAATLVTATLTQLPHRLTPRELEVLTLVAAGHSNPAIAEALFTSPRTVSTQVETIRGKLGAISRTAAGVLAVQHGWARMPMPVAAEALGALDIAALVTEPTPHSATTQSARIASAHSAQASRAPHPIRLALVYPQRGPARHDGTQSRRGAELAVEELNSTGGVRGRSIETVHVDADIYTAAGVARTFETLRHLEVHGALMSYVFDEQAALDAASSLTIPVLHTMTSSRHLAALARDPDRYRTLFQCVPPESNYGPGLARFLELLDTREDGTSGAHERTVRFVETTVDSGQIADAATLALLTERGWRTQRVDPLPEDAAAIDALVAEITLDPPTVLVVSEFLPSVLAALLLRLHAAGCPSVIYTIYAPSVPEFVTEMGAAAEGVVWATVSGTYADPFGAQFRSAYAARYGVTPGLSQAGLAYDMAQVLAGAWRLAADPSDVPGTLTALRATRYRGVNGSYNFAAGLQSTVAYPEQTSDPSMGNAQLIFQVQDGEHRCLGPEPYTDGAFRWRAPSA
ncbi:ABC transporter substrate-binding protein [Leucobacter sp. HY1908]